MFMYKVLISCTLFVAAAQAAAYGSSNGNSGYGSSANSGYGNSASGIVQAGYAAQQLPVATVYVLASQAASSNSGYGAAANSGYGAATNSGYGANVANSGYGSIASNSGYGAASAPSSYGSSSSANVASSAVFDNEIAQLVQYALALNSAGAPAATSIQVPQYSSTSYSAPSVSYGATGSNVAAAASNVANSYQAQSGISAIPISVNSGYGANSGSAY